MAQSHNVEVAKLKEKIAAYKAKFTEFDVAALTAKRNQLVIRKNRYDAKTIDLIDVVKNASAAYKAAETAKNAARAELDKLMAETLKKFERNINNWLLKFSADRKSTRLNSSH